MCEDLNLPIWDYLPPSENGDNLLLLAFARVLDPTSPHSFCLIT